MGGETHNHIQKVRFGVNRYEYTKDIPPNRALIYTLKGLQIATGFRRVVYGGRGAYVEFEDRHMLQDNLVITGGSEWRSDPDHVLYNKCYFILYNPRGEPATRVYYQRRVVDYADYVVGRWYISPIKLQDFKVVEDE